MVPKTGSMCEYARRIRFMGLSTDWTGWDCTEDWSIESGDWIRNTERSFTWPNRFLATKPKVLMRKTKQQFVRHRTTGGVTKDTQSEASVEEETEAIDEARYWIVGLQRNIATTTYFETSEVWWDYFVLTHSWRSSRIVRFTISGRKPKS